MKRALQKTYVYCGPSVRNVARQYSVYSYGIPEYLQEFIDAYPLAKNLIVPLEKFADMRMKLENPATTEYRIFRQLTDELKGR